MGNIFYHNLEIDHIYKQAEITKHGLVQINITNLDFKVYQKESKIYFFEEIDKTHYRLYGVINKQSSFE